MGLSERAIRIGALYALSGAAAAYGASARQGLELAAEEINAAGGLLGRPVELLIEDEKNPAHAVEVVRRMARELGVRLFIGIDSSAVAEAVVPLLPELRCVLMVTHAASPRITGELFNPYVFRCSINVAQNARAGALLVAPLPYATWTTLGPDYSFGYFSWAYFSRFLRELKPEAELLPEGIFHPPGAEDLTPWIRQAMRSGAEALWISSWGGDLVRLIRQGQALGLFRRCAVFMELGAALEVLEALGDEMPQGLWVGTRYWFRWPDTPENRRFVEAYFRRYGRYPSYNAQNAYLGLRLLAGAIRRAGTLEPEGLIPYLEGIGYEAPMGRIMLRREDHQVVADVVWGETKFHPDYPFRILDPIWTFPGEAITPPPEVGIF